MTKTPVDNMMKLPAQMYGNSPNVTSMDMKGYSTTSYGKLNELRQKKRISGPMSSVDSN